MGFMGSGKSLLGRSLAKLLKRPFIDLDQYIEEQEMLSIGEIFETQGEKHFRELEEKYLKKVLESDSEAVIALGGGTPFHPSSFDLIKKKKPQPLPQGFTGTIDHSIESGFGKPPVIKGFVTGSDPGCCKPVVRRTRKHLFESRCVRKCRGTQGRHLD